MPISKLSKRRTPPESRPSETQAPDADAPNDFLDTRRDAASNESAPALDAASARAPETILCVRIPEDMSAQQIDDHYGAPLEEALSAAELGGVIGAGVLSGDDCDALFEAEDDLIGPVGVVDLGVIDIYEALPLVLQTLRDVGAPRGTCLEIHYGDDLYEEVPLLPIH